ncbi:MAG: hypothetical protein ACYCPP_05430 [Nitrososphaerales archaeon]
MISESEIKMINYSKQSIINNLGKLDDLIASIRAFGLTRPIVVRFEGNERTI